MFSSTSTTTAPPTTIINTITTTITTATATTSKYNAATLPRAVNAATAVTTAPLTNKKYIDGVVITANNQENDWMLKNRPTYGAYANNTLPRGPYLQYKFNDQQSSNTMMNDNNLRQNLQIDELKKEFMGLPRVKLSKNQSHRMVMTTAALPPVSIQSPPLPPLPPLPPPAAVTPVVPIDYPDMQCQKIQSHERYTMNKKSQELVHRNDIYEKFQIIQHKNYHPLQCNNDGHRNDNDDDDDDDDQGIGKSRNLAIMSKKLNGLVNGPQQSIYQTIPRPQQISTIRHQNSIHHHHHHQQQHHHPPSQSSIGCCSHEPEIRYNNHALSYMEPHQQQTLSEPPQPPQPPLTSYATHSYELSDRISLNNSAENHATKNSIANDLIMNYEENFKNCIKLRNNTNVAASSFTNNNNNNNNNNNKSRNQLNYVTLAEILELKSNGLSVSEGWALLCQSVQALQDLFLADTPSTSRILPFVNPSSLQITSRGRVAFKIMPTGQMASYEFGNSYCDIMSYLSPEFIHSLGKKITSTESDIEKMWIYSLGVTLHKTLPSVSNGTGTGTGIETTNANGDDNEGDGCNIIIQGYSTIPNQHHSHHYHHQQQQQQQQSNQPINYGDNCNGDGKNNGNDDVINIIRTTGTRRVTPGFPINTNNNHKKNGRVQLTSLDYVISSMCHRNPQQRSSLMYLLDVISEYCKTHHQVKPFSHIVMELFQQVVVHQNNHPSHESRHVEVISSKCKLGDEQSNKSDTDSGRSSEHGEPIKENPVKYCSVESTPINQCNKKLLVKRYPSCVETQPTAIDQMAQDNPPVTVKKDDGVLQVRRRKRRDLYRRNTIDVNLLELDQAKQLTRDYQLNTSKSATCIDKIGTILEENEFSKKIDRIHLNGTSMPDLKKEKGETFPRLKVRRGHENIKAASIDNNLNRNEIVTREKGPDFIVKSFVTPKQIDISEAKCQNRRPVNVLLLNGNIIQVICNPASTSTYQIYEAIIETENYIENFFLGICALIGGDFVFLPFDLKINKVAPQTWINIPKKSNLSDNSFTLFIRIKFYLPSLRGISSLESRHTLYLQLRKSILERHILCTDDDLISLGGLALQSEVGDFQDNMKYMEYFTISHYLPDDIYQKNKQLAQYLRNSHYRKKGLHSLEAEQNFIRYVQELKEYGLHLYSAVWTIDEQTNIDVFVAISIKGICLFHRSANNSNNHFEVYSENSKMTYQRKLYAKFEWLEIENLCYSKHILCVVVRSSESLKAKDNNRVKYKLKMDGRKSYFAFSLASEHHKFYMKLRNSFVSLKMISEELNIPLKGCTSVSTQTSDDLNNFDNMRHDQVPKIDKPPKSNGNRIRNLKKSMLNDNKLLKLRQKFLKRSKSAIEMPIPDECVIDLETKEETQNKENECPKLSENENMSPKSYSLNRNKVKMGTRVFSSQFLNKSFDNINDNALNIARLEINQEIFNSRFLSNGDGGNPNASLQQLARISDDEFSLKSTSLGSVYFSDKNYENGLLSPKQSDAYVIHSSIKSMNNNFSIPNESVSDTLLEKFNNLSCNTTANDRIISRIRIIKDQINNVNEMKESKGNNIKNTLDKIKFATLNSNRLSRQIIRAKNKILSKSQESIEAGKGNASVKRENSYTLGISIVQGTDNNVYVKDLVPNGPGERSGIKIGDQIIVVNGISLLNLPYAESLKLLQNTGRVVDLVVSQIFRDHIVINDDACNGERQINNLSKDIQKHFNSKTASTPTNIDYLKEIRYKTDDIYQVNEEKHIIDGNIDSISNFFENMKRENCNFDLSLSKSAPDLPKVIAIIPKGSKRTAFPRSMGLSRKYLGPVKYPVTPAKDSIKTTLAVGRHQLSLLADDDEQQVFI